MRGVGRRLMAVGYNYSHVRRSCPKTSGRAPTADGAGSTPNPTWGPRPPPSGIAPLLRELMNEYAATGLPPAYVPMLCG